MASIDLKTAVQNMVIGLVVAAGLFFSILILNYSWIKILILSLTLGCGIIWLVSHGKLKKAMKYLAFSLMIFGIFFTSYERYAFWNVGYPSTYSDSIPDVSISYPSILDVSFTELIQSVEKTDAFTLFNLEHFGETTFESIMLHTVFPPRGVTVSFYNEGSSRGLMFRSSGGYPYHSSVISWSGQPPFWSFSQLQTPEETLRQIDNLGLQWFYNRAYEVYQNRTGTAPNTNGLDVRVQWHEYNGDRDLFMEMTGWHLTSNSHDDLFYAAFQPDGTLLYLNIAN